MSAALPEPTTSAAPKGRRALPRTVGEAKVWLTSVGLSLGLLMVAGLLVVIFYHGVRVFWPHPVAQLSLRAGTEFHGQKVVVGEIIKRQEKAALDPKTRAAALARGDQSMELQLYVGNKDAWGEGFAFFDEANVEAKRFPAELMVIERLEYGDAIGVPVALRRAGGELRPAADAAFGRELSERVAETSERWAKIKQLEREKIGAINGQIEELQLEAKLRREKGADASDLDSKLGARQAEYEALAKAAGELRLAQREWELVFQLGTGEERVIPVAQVVGFHYPNQMTTAQRAGQFVHNLWNFLTNEPREANTEGGIFPAIFGTFALTLLMSAVVVPLGVLAAIYLREYARQGIFVRAVRIAINNLAGVPSIVFGVFGLGFFVYFVGGSLDALLYSARLPAPTFGTGGILWAALTLALMTVPVMIVATEEALSAVSQGMREASLACGASKWQTIQRVVLPSAAPGILTGLILAMARGAGEVAPLMLVGVVKLAPSLPLDGVWPFVHLERKFMHLGFHIYDLGFQSPDSEAAKPMVFATTFLLITLVVMLNLGAILIRERLRRKYQAGAF